MTPVHLAFLGTGRVAAMHGKTLRGFGDEVRCSWASRDAARAEAMRTRFPGGQAYGSYEAPLADATVDAIVVVTPPASHFALTLAALEAKKHVVVEKPAFFRLSDFDAVALAATRAGRRVMIAENYFYKPMLALVRAEIASGALGDVRFVQVNALKHQDTAGDWRDDPAQAGGGALFEGGVHWVNFMANLGLPVRAAHGYRAGSAAGPDRSTLVVFEYEGGAIGTLAQSWEVRSPLKGVRLSKVFGTRGSLTFESNGVFAVRRAGGVRPFFPGVRDMLGYQAMWADFLGAVREGREPRLTYAAARRDYELMAEMAVG